MQNLDFTVNDHQQPSSPQNASGRTGLRLVLPPLSAVKALKGKKRGTKGVAFQEPKAPRPVKLKPLKEVLAKLIVQIKKKDDYAFFLEPVNPAQVPGYADIVQNPMDFGTISQKVSKGRYRSLEEFGNDVRLVTGNAKLFNPPGTIYHSEAERVEQYAVDHINRAAASVIEYEGDWNIDGQVDEGLATGQGGDSRGMSMDVDGSSRARSPSVASVQTPVPRRGKGKKEPGTVSESIEPDGHLPGYKDGVGVFPPDSHWAELMLSLKLKGKRYRTKKERMRIERSGPPYAADGSLNYTEVEDPFSILSVFLPGPPTEPYLTALYPSNDPSFPGPSTVPFNRQVYVDLEPTPPKPTSRKRKYWSIQRNAPSRRRDTTNDVEETIPPWKVPREHHVCDYGTTATLQEELAREYRLSNVSANLGSETQLFIAIRRTIDRGAVPNSSHKDDVDLTEVGYWERRGRLAEDFLKDMVYGGVDGLAYARSLAEFVDNSDAELQIVDNRSSTTLGMPLAQYVQETVLDPITEGRHRLIREASERLWNPTKPVDPSVAERVDFSLHRLPKAARELVELRKVYAQQIDMAALLRKREELFLTDDDWAGKQFAEVQKQKRLEEQKRLEAEKERALADGSAHPMQYLRFAIQSHEEAQNSEASPVDSTGMLQYALNYSADLILELAKGVKQENEAGADVKMENGDTATSDENIEEPTLKKLRLQLLASAKRASIDLISDLPPELVPERLREEIESHRNVQSRTEPSTN
ncbi:hypothetical protein BDY19DRAFT_895580 [Irpex rosettiformis]|uniref:Uncharacterized protein n=1 Tax=Irpex rosettiformis TaxID=378272 RepID=A0ACB8TVR0_9APHY|nr:hypothetical protein BDY19DRAFT_895580 [Irpex rosettiformis]